MTTPAFRNCFCWIVVSILTVTSKGQTNPSSPCQVFFLRQDEPVDSNVLPDSICLLHPVYESPCQLHTLRPVRYKVSGTFHSSGLSDSLQVGCNWVSTTSLPLSGTILSFYNILQEMPGILQIVMTKSTGYLQYLEEQIQVPFVLPPRRFPDHTHQTDLRIAVDCAELAIYGRRRQGYRIPYCGPKKISTYMKQVSRIYSGVIIHFGHQVSIVYEDRGIPGELDPDDLLIHAYQGKAEIIPLGNTDLSGQPYVLLDWK